MSDITCHTGQKPVSGGPFKSEVAPFCIDETEVTQEAFMQSKYKLIQRPAIEGTFAGPKKPMIYVSWDGARAYCQAQGGDLPTGEQWEKAARGPTGKTYGTQSGELKPEEANYWHDDSVQGPVDVDSYPANDYGIHNMTGNVWEWTLEECGSGTKCLRGGSWFNAVEFFLSADFRYSSSAIYHDFYVGFRCVSAPQ